jgi:bifunctional isochorismate lyase/aryl carrier protein
VKKDTYYSSATIEAKAREILASVESLRREHVHNQFQLDRAALFVLDMQSYFLNESSHAFVPSAVAILPNIHNLVGAFAGHERPIIFTRHTNSSTDAGPMAGWWRDLLIPDSPLSKITSELDTKNGLVIVKHQYDAFYQTNLEQVLHAKKVDQVIVTGVMTHLCCETTARSAFTRGFSVFFTIDGTATYTEAFHRATVLNLAHGFAVPILTEELLAVF